MIEYASQGPPWAWRMLMSKAWFTADIQAVKHAAHGRPQDQDPWTLGLGTLMEADTNADIRDGRRLSRWVG